MEIDTNEEEEEKEDETVETAKKAERKKKKVRTLKSFKPSLFNEDVQHLKEKTQYCNVTIVITLHKINIKISNDIFIYKAKGVFHIRNTNQSLFIDESISLLSISESADECLKKYFRNLSVFLDKKKEEDFQDLVDLERVLAQPAIETW